MYSVAKPKRFNIKTFLFLFFASPKRSKERGLFQYVFFRPAKNQKKRLNFLKFGILNTPSSYILKKESNPKFIDFQSLIDINRLNTLFIQINFAWS